jgi:hypothetical protein
MRNFPTRLLNLTTAEAVPVESWSVAMPIEQMYMSASLQVTTRLDICFQDEIQIEVELPSGREVLFTGRVSGIALDDSNAVRIEAESKAGVMARTDATPADWKGVMASTVIRHVCEQVSVPVTILPAAMTTDSTTDLVISHGSACLGVIADLCKQRRWIALTDPATGGLVIDTISDVAYGAGLVRGVPPLESGALSAEDKRLEIVFVERAKPARRRRGRASGRDLALNGFAKDPGALKGTVAWVQTDSTDGDVDLDVMAQFRSLSGGAGAIRYTAKVSTITGFDGRFWRPNKRIFVDDPSRRVERWMGLISSVTLSQSATAGQSADLEIVPPAIYYADGPVRSGEIPDPFKGLKLWRV